jgi:Uma2 family endonuclease
MGAITTKLTFAEFQNLPEPEGKTYELDEGELLMNPSPTVQHNRIRDRIARRLAEFVEAQNAGEVMVEVDFRLESDTVRNPDVAFVTADHLRRIDVNRSPVEGAPALAVEVISPANSAQDTKKKVHQFLRSGSRSVWIVYPSMRLVEVHTSSGVRNVQAPEKLADETVLPGFALSLQYVSDGSKP